MDDTHATDTGSVLKGILLTLGLHVAAALVCCLLAAVGGDSFLNGLDIMYFTGVVQVVYVAPAAIILGYKRRPRTRKGLLIGAGITFLVNATCAGIILASIG